LIDTVHGEQHSNGDQERILHEMLNRVITNFKVGVATVISAKDLRSSTLRTNYWAMLAKWWCTRQRLTPHKMYMTVIQYCKIFLSMQTSTSPKIDTSLWTTLLTHKNGIITDDDHSVLW